MTRRPTWKKAQARAALVAIAGDVAAAFNIPAPAVSCDTFGDWEWRCETLELWTKAGRAELNVTISARFAHLYFRFDDPARAAEAFGMSRHDTRLNRHSGKWNHLATPGDWTRNGEPSPQDSVELFRHSLQNDFEKVAEPNPPADEVAAYRAKEAARRAHWDSLLTA
jgi:hypothetical protein